MQTLKVLTQKVTEQFVAFQKATKDATTHQRKAGKLLATVSAGSATFFMAEDGSELTPAAQKRAYTLWYEGIGMQKQFVSNALARAEMARLVPELEVSLNTDHIKRLAPALRGAKGQVLTDSQKVKAVNSTMKKARALAKKAGREESVTGGDIQKARGTDGSRSDTAKKVPSIADVAQMTETATFKDGDTADDLATIAAWLENMETAILNNEKDSRKGQKEEIAA